MARLGDICEIAAGQGAPQGENNYCSCNEGTPFIKAGDLSDLLSGKSENEIQCVNDMVAKQHKLKLYPSGSILFAKSGMSCMKGYVYRTQNPCYIVSHLAIVVPKNIDGEYLKYYFQYNKPNALIKDSAYPSISLQDISNIELTVPSLDTQASIASELNKVNMLISLRKKQLSKLDELVKSRFIEMFGDYRFNNKGFGCKKGSELFKFSSGKFLPEEKRLENGIPVYGGNGISWYTEEALIDFSTIIIGRVGAQCGNIHMVTTPVWITDNAIYIKEQKTKAYTLEFLTELMRMMDFYQYADFSGQPKITQKPLETLEYIMPPIELQREYTAFVEQTDKSKFEIQKSLEKLETLKKSLMQKYFG